MSTAGEEEGSSTGFDVEVGDGRIEWVVAAGSPDTVIEVELNPQDDGTLLRLTHSGFSTEEACKGHEVNWPAALETLDEALRE